MRPIFMARVRSGELPRRPSMTKQKTPEARTGVARTSPDPVILGFSSLDVAPGDVGLRDDFVRAAMSLFARRRGFDRLSRLFLSSSYDELRALLSVLTHLESLDVDDGHYSRAMREVYRSTAWRSAAFGRLASLCADVISWESRDSEVFDVELATYVTIAWPVLCDEVEYEQENLLLSRAPWDVEGEFWVDLAEYDDDRAPYRQSADYTSGEAKRLGRRDLRRFGRK